MILPNRCSRAANDSPLSTENNLVYDGNVRQHTYSSFIHIYLGMPLEEIPFDVHLDKSAAQKIAALIYTTGNFGHHDAAGHKAQDSRYIVHKWKRFTYHLSYYWKVFPLFPKLVLLAQVRWFKEGMKTFFRGLKK